MKNTKELFIRLYIGILYSNFIVPLRKCNYIQLLYGDTLKELVPCFMQTRRLVWQGHINEVDQKLYRNWAGFKIDGLDQNLTKTWLGTLLQLFSNTSPKMASDVIKCHQNFIGLSSKNYHQNTTEIPPEMSVNECKWVQFKIGANRCESVQFLTDSSTKVQVNENSCRQKIGSNRVKSGQKTGVTCGQMWSNVVKKPSITYHLILLEVSFMCCVGQKLL